MEIGTARRPFRGETVCGDVFKIFEHGLTTIAVADGLGHGPKAAVAAEKFCEYAEEHLDESPVKIMNGSTRALVRTRGAAAALIRIDERAGSLEFCGVGNIELRALSSNNIHPISVPGIVGRPLRKVIKFDYELTAGDLLVIFSDGISSRFEIETYKHLAPQQIADSLMADLGKYHDDVTAIVIRF